MYNTLVRMKVEEEGTTNLGSDHKRIMLYFHEKRGVVNSTGEGNDRTKLSEANCKEISKMIEAEILLRRGPEVSYEQFMDILKSKIGKAKRSKRRRKTGRKRARKKWWDAEIREAIQQRKSAVREHRRAKCTGSSSDETEKAWTRYLECKKKRQPKIQAGKNPSSGVRMAQRNWKEGQIGIAKILGIR